MSACGRRTLLLCDVVTVPSCLLPSSEAKKNKPDLSANAPSGADAGQPSPTTAPQPVSGALTSDPGGATPTMSVADPAQAYQAQQQQVYQTPQQQQEAWAAYNQYQQSQQAWAAYYSQYGQQVRGRGRGGAALTLESMVERCCVPVQVANQALMWMWLGLHNSGCIFMPCCVCQFL